MSEVKNDVELSDLKYNYDELVYLEDEFAQIQQCKGMYISYEKTKGAFHLVKEEANNHLDELTSDELYSRGGVIDIYVDLAEQSVTQSDNGRGIPIANLVKVFTKKHSSTKIGRKKNPYSAGQNGVGLKLVVALSDYLAVTTYNGKFSKTLEFNDCKMTEHEVKKEKKERYGTVVKFIPSEKYLGKIEFSQDLFEDWYRRLSYLVPNNITFNLHIKLKDGQMIKKIYKPQPISENVKFISNSLEVAPISLSGAWSSENENDMNKARNLKLERDPSERTQLEFNISFSYDRSVLDTVYNSYCNYVYTIENGTHVDGVRAAICSFLTREAKKMDPKAKHVINWDDCTKGLILCIDTKYTRPEFGGQAKEKVTNGDVESLLRMLVDEKLKEYFSTNQGTLKKIITYLRTIAKARQEVNKIRGVNTKKNLTFMDDALIPGFINIEDRNYDGYKELYIVEGDSAGWNIVALRNPKHQAVLSVFGVLDSTIDMETEELVKKHMSKVKADGSTSSTIINLVNVLGCGIGKTFDINKLKWDKIIIATDKDIDGDNITSSISAFFTKHLPGLVFQKKVYKAVPFLYKLDEASKRKLKGIDHIYDKREFISLYHNLVANSVDILFVDDATDKAVKMSKESVVKWLDLNEDYLLELGRLTKRSYCDPLIIERVCHTLLKVGDDEKAFVKKIKKYYPELDYNFENKVLYGSNKGNPVTLIVDRIFLKNAKSYMEILSQNPICKVSVKRKDEDDRAYEEMTLCQALSMFDVKYKMQVTKRYKGLGEMGSDILFISVVNPLTRKLIALSMTEETHSEVIETMKILHSKKVPEERRAILERNRFKYSDIDN